MTRRDEADLRELLASDEVSTAIVDSDVKRLLARPTPRNLDLAINPDGEFAAGIGMIFRDLGISVRGINMANGWDGSRKLADAIEEGDLDPRAKSIVQHQIVELALIVTEASEAIEELRNGHAANEAYHAPQLFGQTLVKPEGVPSEIADVVIRCVDFADAWGIDLGAAIVEKLNYNATRGFRHGGKAA